MNFIQKIFLGLNHLLRGGATHRYQQSKSDFEFGWRLDNVYFEKQNGLIRLIVNKLREGACIEDALTGFDGRQFGERIVEYPYAINWIRQRPKGTLLDIGCVLNNVVCKPVLSEKITDLWFCNPAIEQLVVEGPLTYRVAKIEKAFTDNKISFDFVTCLSTIEHIGFDNSQYGSTEPARYTKPADEPLFVACETISNLVRPGGGCLISVPFGKRSACKHRGTGKIAFQVFDVAPLRSARQIFLDSGFSCSLNVFAGNSNGWEKLEDPESFDKPYAHGFPGAAAVAILEAVNLETLSN